MDFRSNSGESNDFIANNHLAATSIIYCHSEASSLKKKKKQRLPHLKSLVATPTSCGEAHVNDLKLDQTVNRKFIY
jgi:hypothetical protein